jgi:hypothetical protein
MVIKISAEAISHIYADKSPTDEFEVSVDSACSLFTNLPGSHMWIYDEAVSLPDPSGLISEIDSLTGEYSAYGRDFKAVTLAYAFKTEELCSDSVSNLNAGHYVSAIVLARSALETAVAMLALYHEFTKAREEYNRELDLEKFFDKLQRLSNANVYGRRNREKHFSSVNILTLKDKVARFLTDKKQSERLQKVHESFSDVVHPSADGSQFFWNIENSELPSKNFSSVRFIERYGSSIYPRHRTILRDLIWAISWSAQKSMACWVFFEHAEFSFQNDPSAT